jgi:hypothetical protein
MNQLTLNAIALSIFAMTLSVLLGPFLNISPFLSSGLTLIVLSAVTFDSFRFQSLGLTVLLDTLAQRFPGYRQRVLHHEAGHFLVAHLLDLPIESYTLSVWEALQQQKPGQGGVVLQQPEKDQTQAWLKNNIEKLCAVWAAGGIAEDLRYGSVQGNEDDVQQLRSTVRALGLNVALYERQAKIDARQLIQKHWQSYEALVTLLEQRCSVAECYTGIDQGKSSERNLADTSADSMSKLSLPSNR